ncbi:MAG TPA: HAMP domain-containing sensor histidine kinase [Prevotella sp.]
MKHRSVGRKVFFIVLSIFVLVIALFFSILQTRENTHKIKSINQQLQAYNDRMFEVLELTGNNSNHGIATYIEKHRVRNLRVTLVRPDGRVIFDNRKKDYASMPNHLDRKEIADALKYGKGYDINRASETLKRKYFYSASYYPADSIIIRTALPYEYNLAQTLTDDQMYVWLSLMALLTMAFVLYRFISRLSSNVTKLRIFAGRADRNESLDTEDLVDFPDDELGEISEHIIKLYKRLQKTKEEQTVLKRELTQNVAHELKTPVAGIQGFLETIIHNPDMDAETKQRFLERCYAQSSRLSSLLADISTLNRMDDGSRQIDFETIDVAEIMNNIAEETALQRKEHGTMLVNNLPKTLPMQGNMSLVYSIFRNLVDNATAYAGNDVTVTVSATVEPDCYNFVVSDNGMGVGEEHLQRIFERFYRIDKGRSRKLGGTGLGLAIVKNAVLIHGGSIRAQNNPQGGVAFYFSLNRSHESK